MTNFHTCKQNILVNKGFIAAIREYKVRTNTQPTADYGINDARVWVIIQKGNNPAQSTLVKSEVIPAAVEKWNGKSGVQLQWKTIFLKCKQTTIDTQLRGFQLRLLQRIVPTTKKDIKVCVRCAIPQFVHSGIMRRILSHTCSGLVT